MLYIAFVRAKTRYQLESPDLVAKSRKWWNEGGKPPGLKTLAFYGTLGTETPDVIVFEASDHQDIRRMVDYWREVDFDIHPALDLADAFRRQGMKID